MDPSSDARQTTKSDASFFAGPIQMVSTKRERSVSSEVQTILDLAEELRKADQLDGGRVANAARDDVDLLRAGVTAARAKQSEYQKKADNCTVGRDDYEDRGPTAKRRWQGLADAWRRNADEITKAVGLVLDRAPQQSNRVEPPSMPAQIIIPCSLVVHTTEGRWLGELRLPAIPPIGSTIVLDATTKVSVTEIAMNLRGSFTIHAEPPPAGSPPTRALLSRLGLVPTRR